MVDHFRHRAVVERYDRGAAGQGLDHHQAERLRPGDREQQGRGVAEELRFCGLADLADIVDQRVIQQMLDLVGEERLIGGIDLGRDLQGQAGPLGDLDRRLRSLFRRDPAQKGEIAAAGPGVEAEQVGRQAMVDRARPVQLRLDRALMVGDRDQAIVGKAAIAGAQVLHVEPAMQRGQAALGPGLEHRKMQQIDMEMQNVEAVRVGPDPIKHGEMGGMIRFQRRIHAQGLRPALDQLGPGPAAAAGVQRHIMAGRDQRVGQIGNDALGAAIEPGRHGFVQGRDLRDPHGQHRPSPALRIRLPVIGSPFPRVGGPDGHAFADRGASRPAPSPTCRQSTLHALLARWRNRLAATVPRLDRHSLGQVLPSDPTCANNGVRHAWFPWDGNGPWPCGASRSGKTTWTHRLRAALYLVTPRRLRSIDSAIAR